MARTHSKGRYLSCSLLIAIACGSAGDLAAGQNGSALEQGPVFSDSVSRLIGVYEAVPTSVSIPGEQNAGPARLDALPLTPAATQARVTAQHGPDPKNMCQVLGPFRLMARPDVKFEILRDAPNKLVMLFENTSWGNVRNLRIDGQPLEITPHLRPLWNGDSTAKWEGDVLTVDSGHFTNRTWLNEAAVSNSKQLRLSERMRLVAGGQYLQYQATAVDSEVLTAPVTYTRYFKRATHEIREYNCFDHTPGGL